MTGWNLDFRGGYKRFRFSHLILDFNYNRWNLNNAVLMLRPACPNGSLNPPPALKSTLDHCA